MKRNQYRRKPTWGRLNLGVKRLFSKSAQAPVHHLAVAEDGGKPAWRFWVRLAFLGLVIAGALYLSAASINILILGTDDVNYAQHTDTIMLLHWRPLPRRLAMLSIPRDTQVVLPKRGMLKINAVYAYGNALNGRAYALAMTRSTVENLLGVKVHFIIHVRYSGFITLVDAIGGVPLYVPKRMRYTDVAGGVNMDLMPGYQLLDGRQALNYVRFRHDDEGDLGRMRRQQEFVRAFSSQWMGFAKLPRTLKAFYAFIHQIETDLSALNALYLALEMKGVAGYSWRQAILPGQAVYQQGVSYWQSDPAAVKTLMADLGKPPAPLPAPAATSGTPAAEPKAATEPVEPEATPVPEATAPAVKPQAILPKPTAVSTVLPAPKPTPVHLNRPVKAVLPKTGQPIVRVLNGCGTPGVCKQVADALARHRVHVDPKNVTNAPNFNFTTSLVKTNAKNLPWAKAVATMLGLGEAQIQVVPDKVSYPAVTVIVGKDHAAWVR